ncbi:unnamed protein product [Paramecium sonneborni]|uniref:Uncharacterized protein n=1 Tax=Paramecium sonneborni TaxID=65129 RepID=A0A8S1QSR9_9CILI|nr:unnamed protein product [Paramecium sonneborni]
MINNIQKKTQNFEVLGTEILTSLQPKLFVPQPIICEMRKFIPIKKQQKINSLTQNQNQQSQKTEQKVQIIKEKKIICQKPKQSKKKLIKKHEPNVEIKQEEQTQINQEIKIPEVNQPLTYVIIRTVKIKEIKGEVIINYKDQAKCIQIRNRILSYLDVKQQFPNIDNLEEKILVEIDNAQIMKKSLIGWLDCRDCEEYQLK